MLIPKETGIEIDSQISDQTSSSIYSDFEPTTVNSIPPPDEMCSSNQSLPISTNKSPQQTNHVTVINKRPSEKQLFCKRGSKSKKSEILMEEAIDVMKQFCQPDPPPAPSSDSKTYNDSAHTMALFVESRLRSLSPCSRKDCEDEILKLLTKF